jgi:hypothetical protein
MIRVPTATTVAGLDPEMAAKNMHESTAVIASPPRNWPTAALQAAISRLLIPPRLMMLAASTKNGIAISGNVFRELNSRSGTWVSGMVVK